MNCLMGEELMTATLAPQALTSVSPEVRAFALENGVTNHLQPLLEMTRRLFPEAALSEML